MYMQVLNRANYFSFHLANLNFAQFYLAQLINMLAPYFQIKQFLDNKDFKSL